jgi:DNA gyrase/topoisomerase IV subunit B
MNPSELKVTTLDPRNRRLLKVTIESLLDADRTFVDLLGKDASARAREIMKQSAFATADDLDV